MTTSDGVRDLRSSSGEPLLRVGPVARRALARGQQSACYRMLVVEHGAGTCHVDAGTYAVSAPAVVFATPLQVVRLDAAELRATEIQFHGDFYCIEFHKEEVGTSRR